MRRHTITLFSATLFALTGCIATSDEPADTGRVAGAFSPSMPRMADATTQRSPKETTSRASSRATAASRIVAHAPIARGAALDDGATPAPSQPASPADAEGTSATCPGEQLALDLGSSLTIADTTTAGASDNVAPWCADTTGTPDRVYQLEVAHPGVLHIDVTGSNGFIPFVELRTSGCSTPSNYDSCFAGSFSTVVSVDAGTYWLAIDGNDTSGTGSFSAQVRLAAPACGDGVLNGTEGCDDGNAQNGDGCNVDCHTEQPGPADVCDGDEITFDADDAAQVTGFTAGFKDDYAGTCSSATGGKDHVYTFVAPVTGTLQADVGKTAAGDDACVVDPYGTGCFDRVLYVREGTCADGTELGCSDDPLDGAAIESVSVPVTAGQTYFVFVDGYDGAFYSYGTYVLNLKIVP